MHGSQFGRRSSTELVLKQNTEKDSMLQQELLAEQNGTIHIFICSAEHFYKPSTLQAAPLSADGPGNLLLVSAGFF